MPPLTLNSLDELKNHVGREIGVTDWFPVTQERIQQFADATGDHQWIHVDVERARRESPFKTTIAHGFLTLSLLPQFMPQVLQIKGGMRMGINYGLNRLRFVSPVRSGIRVRARFTLQSIKEFAEGLEMVYLVTVEGEGSEKPCCVAEWVVRNYR
ncbi:MAG TPA: MaoC family dehydratase [Candidatus Angelobacter sp.]|nr:MaoC family dehydratase [Candidatus Angelobacter sp.]